MIVFCFVLKACDGDEIDKTLSNFCLLFIYLSVEHDHVVLYCGAMIRPDASGVKIEC